MGELGAQLWVCVSIGIWKGLLVGPMPQTPSHSLLLDFSQPPAPLKHKVVLHPANFFPEGAQGNEEKDFLLLPLFLSHSLVHAKTLWGNA